jgi:hypothetical protein
VQTLGKALEALSAPRPDAPRGPAGLDAAAHALGLPPFSQVRSPEALLSWLVDLEERLVGRWVAAHGTLQSTTLTQTATEALGCQAQHLVVLRRALGRPDLNTAVERGRH